MVSALRRLRYGRSTQATLRRLYAARVPQNIFNKMEPRKLIKLSICGRVAGKNVVILLTIFFPLRKKPSFNSFPSIRFNSPTDEMRNTPRPMER